jgi:imidazolonepropionase-like amidohydrolase
MAGTLRLPSDASTESAPTRKILAEWLILTQLPNYRAMVSATRSRARHISGRQDQIGSIAAARMRTFVVMKGDPATRIADIENVEMVFKDGAGYDTNKLLAN